MRPVERDSSRSVRGFLHAVCRGIPRHGLPHLSHQHMSDQHQQLIEQGYCKFADVLPTPLLLRLREVTARLAEAQEHENPGRFRAQGSMIPTTADPLFAELIALPA